VEHSIKKWHHTGTPLTPPFSINATQPIFFSFDNETIQFMTTINHCVGTALDLTFKLIGFRTKMTLLREK
jgi:hypothetical protein